MRLIFSVLLFIASLADAQGIQDRLNYSRLWDRVQNKEVAYNHVADIGEFQYYIFVDYSTTPVTVLAKETEESLDRLLKIANPKAFDRKLAQQDILVKRYLRYLSAKTEQDASPHSDDKSGDSAVRAEAITDCVKFYGSDEFYKNYFFGVDTIYIEGAGRPGSSFIEVHSTPGKAERQPRCESTVGKWGDDGDVGGHLIAARFGGWGGRANLTPQNSTLNSTQMTRIENSVAYCMKRDCFPMQYAQIVTYEDILKRDVRPNFFRVVLMVNAPTCPPRGKTMSSSYIPNAAPSYGTIRAIDQYVTEITNFCSGIGILDTLGGQSCPTQN